MHWLGWVATWYFVMTSRGMVFEKMEFDFEIYGYSNPIQQMKALTPALRYSHDNSVV